MRLIIACCKGNRQGEGVPRGKGAAGIYFQVIPAVVVPGESQPGNGSARRRIIDPGLAQGYVVASGQRDLGGQQEIKIIALKKKKNLAMVSILKPLFFMLSRKK